MIQGFHTKANRGKIAKQISSLCEGYLVRCYTSGKLRTDPLYDGVYRELKGNDQPLLDIGCGMGILAMYLRERGWINPVSGFDYDASKISDGRMMLANGSYETITLDQGDARTSLPPHSGNVTILDILQFFNSAEQEALLKLAGERVAPGGKLIVRSCLKEKNLRFGVTWVGDIFAKATFWMKAAPVCYPTREFFRKALESQGFEVTISPLWENTPFNNFIIVATRPEH